MEHKTAGILLILMIYAGINLIASDEFVVESPAGTFKGTVLNSLQGRLYKSFLGIPYAEPPVGELRFARPKALPRFESVYDATTLPPICVQPVGVDLGGPAQEDCLYLNVYTPLEEKDNQNLDELKKVFVYIHGGGFFMGSSLEYMPGDLVALGDVIVVTFNYRLSWLGFLKGNTPKLPGNQGMWDQLMALTWVKNNIRSFGGDPDDITIGGNSMGGESVSAWSVLSQGKNVFTKGFVMSGSMFTCPSVPGSSDILLELLTDRVGCKEDDVDAMVSCLRNLPTEKFILPIEGKFTNKFTTIDGELFPMPFEAMLKDQDYLASVGFYKRNYIVTLTNNEGLVEFSGPFSTGIDPEEISAEFLSRNFRLPENICEKMLDWYQGPGHFSFKPAYDILADKILIIPSFEVLEIFGSYSKRTDPDTGKSYFMLFDYQPEFIHAPSEGLGHGLDLTYIFDMEPSKMLWDYYQIKTDERFTEKDFRLKNLYIKMLVEFMHTGDPSAPFHENSDLEWPAFDLETEHYLKFAPEPSVDQFPMKERRDFWKDIFPQYIKESQQSQLKEEL